MSTDLHLAFDHPEIRAAATAGAEPLDRISLRDYTVDVEIGAFQSERGTTQRICFNIVVEVRTDSSDLEDDVDRILSYDTITQAIAHELAAERLNLLETLAERIADRVLLQRQAARIFVRVEKLDRGPGALGVEIVRSNAAVPREVALSDVEAVKPIVVYFSNDAIESDLLPNWLDQLEETKTPIIVCVGIGDENPPAAHSRPTQRRINLLAIEQNAWVLAGRDDRCVVRQTRTELDWAIQQGEISVWAPSKMVLDAVDGPEQTEFGARKLAVWFAQEMGVEQIIAVDAHFEAGTDLQVTNVALQDVKIF